MAHITKEYQSYYRVIGEEIIWFRFDTVNSRWNDVYDEGGKTYLPGVRLPALWVDQIEDPEQYAPDGRRPRQRLRFAVGAWEMNARGIGSTEAHGRKLDTVPPPAADPIQVGRPYNNWLDDRVNDVVYYDKRFYSVSNFQIRGRAQFDDAIIGVSCLELIPDDESVFDLFPWNTVTGLDHAPIANDLGLPLIAILGQDNTWTIDYGSVNNLTGSTWLLRVYADDGEEILATLPVDTTDQATGVIRALLDEETADLLGVGEFPWALIQQFGVISNPSITGVLHVVASLGDALEVDTEGDNFPEITLEAVEGASAVWSFYFGVPLTGSDWSMGLYQNGTFIAQFTVDSRWQEDGLVVALVPKSIVDILTVGDPYQWRLIQLFDSVPPLLVSSGLFVVNPQE